MRPRTKAETPGERFLRVWWPPLIQMARDVACLTVGVWLLLFTDRVDATRAVIGALLLTLSAAGAAKAIVSAVAGKGDGK